jgi:hypothetical protein
MSSDINYLAPGDQEQLIPFIMDGTCDGVRSLLQKCVMLVLADKDEVFRPDAVGLYENLKSATMQEYTLEIIKNTIITGANTVQINVIREQASDTTLTDSGKLSTFTMESLETSGQDGLIITFKAVTVSGESASSTTTI